MSIFKVKEWWSNETWRSGETAEGTLNVGCMKVDKFNTHSESDCVIVGEDTLLKIYKPSNEENISPILLETELEGAILQLETGKFTVGAEDREILVLHPHSYSIYKLRRKEGHTDAGEQNLLKEVLKHSFTRKAYNVCCGPFGNIKTRDFVCVQSLDGTLSFFDQDTLLFVYTFNDVIIPGPVAYIASNDSFVICKPTWVLEIHSYQQLREFSELKLNQDKKNIPQWLYNAGEEISTVQIIQTSSNFSSLIALGERHLCCFQDNGLMKYIIKFDYIPTCFSAYLIGWYYEPGARLLIMVASDDSKLYIYEGTALLWSCDLLHTAISISRCFMRYLPGGIVSMSSDGMVHVCYLGTKPDLNANATGMIADTTTPEEIQAQLESVEESLQKVLNGKEDADGPYPIEQIIKIKSDVGKPVQNLSRQFTKDNEETRHLLMCPIVSIITCDDPKEIQSIQITHACNAPFGFSEPTMCLDNINGTEIIETQIFASDECDIPEAKVTILFTITGSAGKISVITREILLPLSLYCYPTDIVIENSVKLQIETDDVCTDITEILTDFAKEDLLKYGNHHTLTFVYRTTKKTVTIKATSKHYLIEANDFPEVVVILRHFVMKLSEYFMRNMKGGKIKLSYDDECSKTLCHKFLKCIERHAKERIILKNLEDELGVLQRQFTVIQKRLLVQYGSLPPGDCEPLEYLMKDTHQRLVTTVNDIVHSKGLVCSTGCTLAAVGHLIIYIFKNLITDEFKIKLIEEMFSFDTLYEMYQEWEESVTQALTYILNNVFKKSEKDKEKLAPVTEQGVLSQVNLKRFLKQIRNILDKLFAECKGDTEHNDPNGKENRVIRLEELVDVI